MKNLVFDIDGTISFNGQTISPLIVDEIHNLSANFTIFFASARHPRDIIRILPQKLIDHAALVGANGSICMKDNTVLYKKTIDNTTVDTIIHLLSTYECSYLIDAVRGFYKSDIHHDFFEYITPFGSCDEQEISELKETGVLKFLILSSNDPDHQKLQSEIQTLPGISLHRHSDGTFDITASSVDKYTAIHESFHIKNNFICFGNDQNDLPLFQNSNHSFLIGDHEALRPYATEQILEYSEEKYIESIVRVLREHEIFNSVNSIG